MRTTRTPTHEQMVAIKEYRSNTGCTLQDAYSAVVLGGREKEETDIARLRARVEALEGALIAAFTCRCPGAGLCVECRNHARRVLGEKGTK